MGVRVLSATPIDESLFASIDAGLSDVRERAAHPPNNYTNIPTHGQFSVGLWPRSNKCINPGFTTRLPDGNPWDGTEYDKDPEPGKVLLCVAGLAPAYGNSQGGIPTGTYGVLVVNDAGIMRQITDFEAEHELLYALDINKWMATAGVHAHPLITRDSFFEKEIPVVSVRQTMVLWLESDGPDSFTAQERDVILHVVK